MKKKQTFHGRDRSWSKLLLIMRLTILLFFAFVVGAQAKSYSQSANLTLNLTKTKLVDVLSEIEKQSGYYFYYKLNLDDYTVGSIEVKNKNMKEVLEKTLREFGLTYQIVDRYVIIKQAGDEAKGANEIFSQQQKTLSGKVTDSSGGLLPGVAVVVKGTTKGTITDVDGKYTLPNVPLNSVLVFSFVGMKTLEVAVENKTTINVTLSEESIGLDEVVAIGYGSQKKKDITGSVASISDKDFQNKPMSNIGAALTGRVAGLDVVSSAMTPGSTSSILLRGKRSFVASNDPLIILDGITFYGSINDINPYDIKSVDVLKDASSTAIYGSRGSNGVIIITTKRGQVGSPKFVLDSYAGLRSNYGNIPVLNSQGFVDRAREAARAAGTYPLSEISDENDKLLLGTIQYANYKAGVDTNWQDLLYQNGFQQKHQLSVTGGSEAVQYNVSGNYFDQEGTIPTQKFDRYSLKTNLDIKLSPKFKAGTSTLLSYTNQNQRMSGGSVGEALVYSPLGKPYDENGNPILDPVNDSYRLNPLVDLLYDSYRYANKHSSAYINLYGEYTILPTLTYRINLNADVNVNTKKKSATSNSIVRRRDTNYASIQNEESNRYGYEGIITYDKTINKDHHLTVTGINSVQKSHIEADSIQVTKLPYDPSRYYNIGSATTVNSYYSNLNEWSLLSFAGRVFYGFKEKYLLTLTMRSDAATQFAPKHKWGYFPSAAFGWRISEENFLKRMDWISNLKLRLSYGVSGNQAISPYQTQGSLTRTTYAYDESPAYGLRPAELANKDLKWETTGVYNIGFDFGFLQGRINGNLELYKSKTTDLLMYRYLPVTTGFETVLQNVGITQNKGFELSLNTINIEHQNFRWENGLTFYLNREQIVELYNGKVNDVGNKWFIGQPIGVYYDYKKIGIWQSNEAAEAAKYGYKPGQIKLLDVNNDGAYTDVDRIIVGSRQPKFVFNLNNTFKYYNWDLTFDLYTRWGSTIYCGTFVQDSFTRLNKLKMDYWTPNNPTNSYPQPNNNFQNYTYSSTLGYRDGSFIKLKQLSLGYTIPQSMCNNLHLSNARIYISGENLMYWTKSDLKDFNLEPEWSGDALGYSAYRTFIMGVNISF